MHFVRRNRLWVPRSLRNANAFVGSCGECGSAGSIGSGGLQEAWTPASLSGLVTFYEYGAAYLTKSSPPDVDRWDPVAGTLGGYLDGTAAPPSDDGTGVRFDGAGEYMTSTVNPTVAGGSDWTAFFKFIQRSTPSGQHDYVWGSHTSEYGLSIAVTPSLKPQYFDGTTLSVASNAITVGTTTKIIIRSASGALTLRVNGTDTISTEVGGLNLWLIGRRNSGYGPADMTLISDGLYNRALTNDELTLLGDYLS